MKPAHVKLREYKDVQPYLTNGTGFNFFKKCKSIVRYRLTRSQNSMTNVVEERGVGKTKVVMLDRFCCCKESVDIGSYL